MQLHCLSPQTHLQGREREGPRRSAGGGGSSGRREARAGGGVGRGGGDAVPFLGGDGAGRRRRRARRRRIDSSAIQSSSAGVESTPPLFNRASRHLLHAVQHRPAREAGACRAQACPSHAGCCRRRRCACSPSHALLRRRVGHVHRREARCREWGPCSRAGGCDHELLGRRGGTRREGPGAASGEEEAPGEEAATEEKMRRQERRGGREKGEKKKRKRENTIEIQYLLETTPNALPLLHCSREANIYLPLKNA
ncbi:hypothetical protein PVAP13_9NG081673 [Panicum virgatum]|uniref:Uncharacterized protein n=1 Tax=Panicum virgatum TaxID=38727 RepID=A0A8T0MCT6_PANVG|nr:hypothetical protein PVAP13_9NG081673 [Panicum virgatum]